MTEEQFWHGEPRLAGAYRRADKIRREQTDEQLWMQGRYVYDALIAVSPLLNPMSKKNKAHDYLNKSYTSQYRDRAKDAAAREEAKEAAFLAHIDKLIAKQQEVNESV